MLSEQEWLELRKKYITATEMGCVLGVNKFRSAIKMWEEKTGENQFTGNAYTVVGQWLEPVVVEATNMKLGRNFELYKGRKFLEDKELRIGATPDAHDDRSILECKTTKPRNFVYFNGAPPDYYIIQIMTQLMLSPEKENAYLSIMGTDLTQTSPELKLNMLIFEVSRNERLIELMRQEVRRFWETVEQGKKFRCKSVIKRTVKVLCRLSTRLLDV